MKERNQLEKLEIEEKGNQTHDHFHPPKFVYRRIDSQGRLRKMMPK